MEKKNTNKGLEEISKIFLSSDKEKTEERVPRSGLSAIAIRSNTTCHSCNNMIEGSSKELKCRIFTFEHEKYGVTHLDTIHPTYANYCENYEPEKAEQPTPSVTERPQEQKPEPPPIPGKVDMKELATLISEMDQDYSEIEETFSVYKKLSFPNTPSAHEKLKNSLSLFTENGYSIEAVELVRRKETSSPQERKVTEEKVSLRIKK